MRAIKAIDDDGTANWWLIGEAATSDETLSVAVPQFPQATGTAFA